MRGLVIFSALLLTACGKAEITSNCSLNGRGDVQCTFKNTGKAKGSTCEYIALISTNKENPATGFRVFAVSKAALELAKMKNGKLNFDIDNDESIPLLLSDGDRIFGSPEICSGIVEPQDIRKSEAFIAFGVASQSPYDLCNGKYEDSWTTKCGFTTVPKEKVADMLKKALEP